MYFTYVILLLLHMPMDVDHFKERLMNFELMCLVKVDLKFYLTRTIYTFAFKRH